MAEKEWHKKWQRSKTDPKIKKIRFRNDNSSRFISAVIAPLGVAKFPLIDNRMRESICARINFSITLDFRSIIGLGLRGRDHISWMRCHSSWTINFPHGFTTFRYACLDYRSENFRFNRYHGINVSVSCSAFIRVWTWHTRSPFCVTACSPSIWKNYIYPSRCVWAEPERMNVYTCLRREYPIRVGCECVSQARTMHVYYLVHWLVQTTQI